MVVPTGRLKLLLTLCVATSLAFFYLSWQRQTKPLAAAVLTTTDSSLAPTPLLEKPSATSTTRPRKRKPALVAATNNETESGWMGTVKHRYDIYRYNVHDQNPPPQLRLPANKGHEAMVYLTFMIDHYSDLPPYAVFIHGHERSWHQQSDMIPLLRNIRVKWLEREGYISLRCDWYPSCPAEIRPKAHDAFVWGPGVHRQDAEDAIIQVWDHFFPHEELPETISSTCCAQFAVTAAAIRRRPVEDYERMRSWLLDTELEDDISGRVMEKLWAYIMTGDAVHCPPPGICACRYFADCGEHEWPELPDELKGFVSDFNETGDSQVS